MRVAAQVLLAYGLVLVTGVLWRLLPLERTMPDVVALTAVYLGLTARHKLAPSLLGAIVIGYLGDLLIGSPRGIMSLTAGITCVLGHLVHRRLIVRGRVVTVVFAFFTGLFAGTCVLVLRAYLGTVSPDISGELLVALSSAALTAVAGPPVFRLCRLVDARFARTHREREATLEGIVH